MGIVTDGLIGYWHYQQGVSGSTWANIAPATQGQYNGQINGAVVQSDGMYFDGVDDKVLVNGLQISSSDITIEIVLMLQGSQGNAFNLWKDADHRIYAPINLSFWEYEPQYGSATGSGYHNANSSNRYSNISNIIYAYGNGHKKTYVDNQIDINVVYAHNFANTYDFRIGCNFYNIESAFLNAKIQAVRVYGRDLTDAERQQNYEVGISIGLESEPPQQEPPKPTIINISRTTISDEPNMDRANVTFTFDQDVTEWRVRTIGTDHDTGILADSGGAVSAGTEITAEVDYSELYGEGQNRVNIYGKNSDGQWTPYE